MPGFEESLQAADRRPAVPGGPGATRQPEVEGRDACPGSRLEGIRLVGRLEDGREAAGRELPGLAPRRQRDGQPAQARRLGQDHLQGAAAATADGRQPHHGSQPSGMGGMALRFAQALAEYAVEPERPGSAGRCTSAAATSSPR